MQCAQTARDAVIWQMFQTHCSGCFCCNLLARLQHRH